MKKKYKLRIIGILALLFVTTNAFMIYFDQDNKVEQKSYINEWSKSFTFDLYKELHTEGVFASTEAKPVYFDESLGSFQEFITSEGTEVSEGDELYEYEVNNYEQQQRSLEEKADRLEEEISAIEDYIDEIESFTVPESENDDRPSSPFPGLNDDSTDNDTNDEESQDETSTVDTEFLKEEKLAQKEMELAQKEAMLTTTENQLESLEEDGQTITVESPVSGVVTEISEDLQAPLITIKATSLQIEGELNESERKEVEEGQTVEIQVSENDNRTTGSLETVRQFPDEVSVNTFSEYGFSVNTEESFEEALPGYHAELDIITEEAEEATVAFKNLLITEEDLYAWVMTENGDLERRVIETELEENGLVEVTSGLESGEWLAYTPRDEFRNNAPFFTPIDFDELYIQELFDVDETTMKTYGLLGLLAR
ncbi:efflux RND transporter periplasmic adaptor subunit [Thalassobacillus sp. CUG 92003]|uniref:efflux RND transporter periplasmic adaptor subunit n=1 Tax=Thalassobacillus sp. CUG 92003 TaxID=2736641 RepID=UPI0015E6BF4B|nr:efflux RND transporter periplasmic adaptor subunit [Thalassobacillus sp. CUG 92003]